MTSQGFALVLAASKVRFGGALTFVVGRFRTTTQDRLLDDFLRLLEHEMQNYLTDEYRSIVENFIDDPRVRGRLGSMSSVEDAETKSPVPSTVGWSSCSRSRISIPQPCLCEGGSPGFLL